jgi:hypothetical protein
MLKEMASAKSTSAQIHFSDAYFGAGEKPVVNGTSVIRTIALQSNTRSQVTSMGNTRAQDENIVKSWGFAHVFTWTDGA